MHSPSLPLVSNDVDESKARRRKGFTPWAQRSAVAVILMLFVASFMHFGRDETKQDVRQLRDEPALPLSKFSDLSYALKTSDLVALYFAASWCGMSTPISRALDEAFGDSDEVLTLDGQRKTLSIVYVSSDRSLEDYRDYISGRNWLAIPYESEERTLLKQHFKTCARPEMGELGIDREHEIPTIIVIDSSNHEVLTTEGVKDMRYLKEEALDHWIQLQQKAFDELAEIQYIMKTT